MKNIIRVFSIFLICMVFAGCANAPATNEPPSTDEPSSELMFTPHFSAAGIPDRLTAEEDKIVIFSNGNSSDFHWADGYSNGNEFNCVWRKNNAQIKNGVMSMSVTKEKNGYAGAEYRTDKLYSYGFYSVCMKAAKCSGVISSFFTYTNKPVWDEIDIEFLGKDMTHVQFNYFTSGVGGQKYYLDLGFDASESFHEYAFEWKADSIVWYVDGKAVYKVTENLPSHPMQIMANVWNCTGADEWSGAFDASKLPAVAEYKWFAYSAEQ